MERLAQYMARPPISLSKVTPLSHTLEEQGANVLFHTKYNPCFSNGIKYNREQGRPRTCSRSSTG